MIIEIKKIYTGVFDIYFPEYRRGALRNKVEEVNEYLLKEIEYEKPEKVDLFVNENITDEEYNKIVEMFKRGQKNDWERSKRKNQGNN